MKSLAIALAGLFVCVSASTSSAQSKSNPGPSGTWRWELNMNGETINNVLKLQSEPDGGLLGSLEARDRKMEIKDGKFKDGRVTFQIVAELRTTVTIDFDGKLDGDKLTGDIRFSANGETRETAWDAKRSVESSDVVGVWELKIETPDGQKLTPVLTVTNSGKNLAAKYESNGTVIDAKEVKIKDNHLLFQIDTDLDGAPLHVEFKGRPYGTKLAGTLEYSVNGDTGELDFAGLCKAESKP